MINTEFPIKSQTSDADKEALLKLRDLLQSLGSYTYLEIGSYLGGSLPPFLKDTHCTKILSIDQRGQNLHDERGARIDYTEITNDMMMENLHSHDIETSKLETFDGSIDQYLNSDTKYDFIFIDGEHTDKACFRDFIHSRKFFKSNCIVAFHDTSLIYKAIQNINELLIAEQVKFKFIKIKNSDICCLFFNDLVDNTEDIFEIETDLNNFYEKCETDLLLTNIKNRFRIDAQHFIRSHRIFKQ